LSEFDFEIGLVELTKLLSKKLILKEQRKDSFCKEQTQNSLTANGQYFWTWMEFCGGARGKQPKLVVPQSLIQDVIAENHDSIFVAHPGNKRTFELTSLRCWWPKMRQSVDEYVRHCDKCQKGKHELRAPLGEVEDSSEPFLVASLDITGPDCVTPRKTDFC
jgi:hypothetical protein